MPNVLALATTWAKTGVSTPIFSSFAKTLLLTGIRLPPALFTAPATSTHLA